MAADSGGGGGGLLASRWGISLAALTVGLAVFLSQQYYHHHNFDFLRSVFTGAKYPSKIYCYQGVRTGTADLPQAQCFEVTADGLFRRVGERTSFGRAGQEAGHEGEEEKEGYVIPGLWDGHGHLLQYGEFLHSVDLFGSASFDEVNRRIAAYVDAAGPGMGGREEWIRGVGWDQMALGGMPSAAMLARDERLKGLYIIVDRVDVHCTWVSPAVLALLPDDVPDMRGGEIVRDPGMGVFCDNAMDIVTALWPRPDRNRKKQFVRSAMRKLHEVGLVGMHDAGATPQDLAMFKSMAATAAKEDGEEEEEEEEEGEEGWSLRVYAMLECRERNTVCLEEASHVYDKVGRDNGGMLTIRSVKLFADGALGSWGSAMLEPYADRPETSGSLLTSEDALVEVVDEWAANGWQVNVHAIGDRANRAAVDAIYWALVSNCIDPEQSDEGYGQWWYNGYGLEFPKSGWQQDMEARKREAQKPTPGNPLGGDANVDVDEDWDVGGRRQHGWLRTCQRDTHRFRIEHAQIIHPDDQARIRELGIIPSVQPTHATSDMAYAEKRLGPERTASSAYRMRSFLNHSLPVVLGSDFPVEPPDPFQGIYAAVARRSPHTGLGGPPPGTGSGWHVEEALTLDQALEGFTRGPAYGGFMEGKAGVIRKGAYADWVVLDRPIEGYDVEELRSLKVKETWVGGKRVFAREEKEEKEEEG